MRGSPLACALLLVASLGLPGLAAEGAGGARLKDRPATTSRPAGKGTKGFLGGQTDGVGIRKKGPGRPFLGGQTEGTGIRKSPPRKPYIGMGTEGTGIRKSAPKKPGFWGGAQEGTGIRKAAPRRKRRS